MKIKSLSGELVAIVSRLNDITEKRNFYTENDAEMQFASFSLPKGENIKRHKHDKQERTVYSTSEGIVVLKGCIEVILYEQYIVEELLDLNKIKTNEFSHISYLIEQEPEVIICNSTDIISGVAVKRDFYNCAVDDYKKNYKKLDTLKIKNNSYLNLYKNPYEEINVYIKSDWLFQKF